jgi:hypothetical protein
MTIRRDDAKKAAQEGNRLRAQVAPSAAPKKSAREK